MSSWFSIGSTTDKEVRPPSDEGIGLSNSSKDVDDDDVVSNKISNDVYGILDMRAKYAEALNELHCSVSSDDESWIRAKECFEEIIEKANVDIPEESAAASQERKFLAFLSCSNLSRMLSKVHIYSKAALNYALDAASMMSFSETTRHDPGLLLRLAKMTLDSGDYWSCRQILDHRIHVHLESRKRLIPGVLPSHNLT